MSSPVAWMAVPLLIARACSASTWSAQPEGDQTRVEGAREAATAVRFLCTAEGVDPDRMELCGGSEGVEVALLAAAQDPEIAYAISMSGGFGMTRMELSRYRTKTDYWPDGPWGELIGLVQHSPTHLAGEGYQSSEELKLLTQVRCPVLAVWGEEDDFLPPPECGLASGIPPGDGQRGGNPAHPARRGSFPSDARIPGEEFAPGYPELLADWLRDVTGL